MNDIVDVVVRLCPSKPPSAVGPAACAGALPSRTTASSSKRSSRGPRVASSGLRRLFLSLPGPALGSVLQRVHRSAGPGVPPGDACTRTQPFVWHHARASLFKHNTFY